MSHLRRDICEPLVYESMVYGPLPTGLESQPAWSLKNAEGSGANAAYPRVSGQVENFWDSLTVKVWGPVTLRPESVVAVGLPESGWTAV